MRRVVQKKIRNGERKGFTLIEILFVISIIAILAALLMPALSTAKDRGKLIKCINNMHQLGIAFQMYANDWSNRVPRGQQDITDSNAGPYPNAAWSIHLQWRRYLPGIGTNYWLFPTNNSVLLCPSDPPESWSPPITNNPPLMQEYGGSFIYNNETSTVDGIIPTSQPARRLLLLDAPPKDGFGWQRLFDQSNYGTYLQTSTFPSARRHFGKSNALYFDWHVQTIDPGTVTIDQVQLN